MLLNEPSPFYDAFPNGIGNIFRVYTIGANGKRYVEVEGVDNTKFLAEFLVAVGVVEGVDNTKFLAEFLVAVGVVA